MAKPKEGDWSSCTRCGLPVEFTGERWRHVNDGSLEHVGSLKHIAVPNAQKTIHGVVEKIFVATASETLKVMATRIEQLGAAPVVVNRQATAVLLLALGMQLVVEECVIMAAREMKDGA